MDTETISKDVNNCAAGDSSLNVAEKIFLPNGEEGFKDGDVFYFYYGNIFSLSDIKDPCMVHLVGSLIIIGQPLTDLNGLFYLTTLTDLWLVEGELEDIADVLRCTNLKKLYLYANKIKIIPNLKKLNKLEVLWLSKNRISEIESNNIPKNLQELNIADNRIRTIPRDCFTESNTSIKSLNFSGNPILALKEIDNFIELPSLQEVVFSDPVYDTSPICYVNNYRSYAIYILPQIDQLDHTIVTREERILTQVQKKINNMKSCFFTNQEFFENTLLYYRVLKNQLLAKHYKELRAIALNELVALESIRKCLINLMEKQRKEFKETEEDIVKQLRTSDYEFRRNSFFRKAVRLNLETSMKKDDNHFRYQAKVNKIEFELSNVGRYLFKNYEMNSMLGTICQKLLNEFTCCYMKRNLRIKSAELFRVTHIYDSGFPQFKKIVNHSLNFFIVASPIPITDLKEWSISALDRFLMKSLNEDVTFTLTDCLFSGDLSLKSPMTDESSSPRVALVVYTRNCKTIESTSLTCHGAAHDHHDPPFKQCNSYVINSCDTVPSFIIEFSYKKVSSKSSIIKNKNSKTIVEKLKSPRTKIIQNNSVRISQSMTDETLAINNYDSGYNVESETDELQCTSRFSCYLRNDNDLHESDDKHYANITLENQVQKIQDWDSLTDLNLSRQNITSVGSDLSIELASVISLDVSNNYLNNLKNLPRIFPSVKKINASFNTIKTLTFCQEFKNLEELDITWNQINKLVINLLRLKSNVPKLVCLDIRYNPIQDIQSVEHVQLFVKKYLTSLTNFNGSNINDSDEVFTTVDTNKYLLQKLIRVTCPKHTIKPLTLEWTSELCQTKDKIVAGLMPHAGYDHSGKLICIMARGLKYFQNVLCDLPDISKVRFMDLSKVALDLTHCLRPAKLIEELNLSDNLLRYMGKSFTGMNSLVVLDVSHNYITSLRDMSDSFLPALKILNVSCNRITSFCGMNCCPNLQELYASHNCLYNLDSVKTVKNLSMLRTIALNHNMIEEDHRLRFFLIYHLHNLEFINGIRIDEEEEAVANEEYSGIIDSDYLFKELSGVQLPHLTKLALSKCSLKEVNLNNSCLVNLKVLDLEYNSITNMEGMADLPSLEVLNLGWNRITSFYSVAKDISNVVDKLEMKRPERKCLKNSSTEVTKSKSTSSVEHKSELPLLYTHLIARDESTNTSNKNEDAKKAESTKKEAEDNNDTPKSFQRLKVLALHSNHITSLLPLNFSQFPLLDTLILNDNDISSLSGLRKTKNLHNIILDKNKITTISTEDVEDITKTATELYLESNNLKSMKFIRKFLNLKKLFLAQNRIQDLQELKNLENLGLQELTLWSNAVCRHYNYYTAVLECLPDLKRFDGVLLQNSDQEKSGKKKTEASCGDSNIE